ncbi:MAG: hypothetical protein QMD78_02655 [Methanocellales archaeon]|nr:hypothetical protein [Methanocellales archaeon]
MGMPIPIVNSHNITKFLGAYRHVQQASIRSFREICAGLIASEKGGLNITDINDLYVDRCHQSSLNRFLMQSPWDAEEGAEQG